MFDSNLARKSKIFKISKIITISFFIFSADAGFFPGELIFESYAESTEQTKKGKSKNKSSTKLNIGYTYQLQSNDDVIAVQDPIKQHGEVIKFDFQKGFKTPNSDSLRSEILVKYNLEKGKKYTISFGVLMTKNVKTNIFQILDPAGVSRRPRIRIEIQGNKYKLIYRLNASDSKGSSIEFGDPSKDLGKWVDFKIDFERNTSGSFKIYKNNVVVASKSKIATMDAKAKAPALSKFGQYRCTKDTTPAPVYFSDFKIVQAN